MTQFLSIPLIALLSLLSIPAWAQECSVLKTPHTAHYRGSFKGWRVNATQQLAATSSKGQWQFTSTASNPVGSITQQSLFKPDSQHHLLSQHYHYQRKVLLKTETLDTVYDWKARQASTTRDDTMRVVALQGGELDDLNYQLAIRCDLLAGQTEFRYPVVDRKEIDWLDFKVVGEEKLETALGVLDTVIVKRIRNNNNRITTLWFAKTLDYQMVKLLQEERKETEAYLLYIESLSKP